MTLLELQDPNSAKAMREIKRIAGELKIASGELLLRFSRTLQRVGGDAARAVSQFEIALNLPRGKLKGFDALYAATK